jgi:hypothetical protein
MTTPSTIKSPEPDAEPITGANTFDEMVERQATIRREAVQTRRAAQSTYDGVLWVLREYGVSRLGDDWMLPRLAEFSPAQIRELVAAMRRLKAKGWRHVTDELIQKLEAMR